MPASSLMPSASAWLECSSSRPPRSLARVKQRRATSSCPLPRASSPSWRHLDSLSARKENVHAAERLHAHMHAVGLALRRRCARMQLAWHCCAARSLLMSR